jgi:GR25 family glycosyltransferase involved in LPS biosynthesis
MYIILCAILLIVYLIYNFKNVDNFQNKLSFNDYVDVIYYINLDHRTDRNEQLLNELKKINFPEDKIVRISAIYDKRGEVGCSHSHVKTIETFIKSNYNNCLVLEDDFEFTQNSDTINNLFNKLDGIDYDVIMLSSNTNEKQPTKYDFLDKIINAQTTSGYMVNRNFAPKLLDNFKTGVQLLENNCITEAEGCAIDQYWKLLQPMNNWYVTNPKLGKQRESYSDIQKGHVNYQV